MDKKGLLFVISGPAGSGKGTVIGHLMRKSPDFSYSVSATSRPILAGEKDGVNYFYVTREEFEKRIENGGMLEYTEYCGNYYGTPRAEAMKALETGTNLILEIEVEGAMQVRRKFPSAVMVMIIPPDVTVQEQRLRTRGRDSEDSIRRRLERTKKELTFLPEYDYVITNYDGKAEQVADTIIAIAEAEKHSSARCGFESADYFRR